MPGQAAKIIITEKQQAVLQTFTRAKTTSKQLDQRAQIILLAFEGTNNIEIARAIDLDRRQVGLWRRRWQESFNFLVAIECEESHAALQRAIEDVLRDAPRPGCPGKFTAEQVASILAVACEPPRNSGRPIDYWTLRELADEVVKRGIVDSISVTQVARYLAEAALWPHRSEYWLNTTEKDEALFQEQVRNVCDCYLDAPQQFFQYHTHTVCVDEMTSIQALERQADALPMRPGEAERIEANYKRHGTLCLIGSWHIVLGQMISPTTGPTRTDEDFAWHIQRTIATAPEDRWIFVADNLNIHSSESLVRYVAQLEGIAPETLGVKNRRGVLKSVATRQAFLSDTSHRIRFVYLPKHTSWLNQIEAVFGIIRRRALRRGSFPSLAALQERMLAFIDYFNRTFAKPFCWTYTGRPLLKTADKRPRSWKEKWISNRQAKESLALVA